MSMSNQLKKKDDKFQHDKLFSEAQACNLGEDFSALRACTNCITCN